MRMEIKFKFKESLYCKILPRIDNIIAIATSK